MNEVKTKPAVSKLKVTKFACMALVLIGLLIFPNYASMYHLSVVILIFLYMALGQMWNFLGGYAGLPSLGQQTFVGLGGYSLAIICQVYGMPIPLGLLVGGLLCALFALVISAPIFKMSGTYFTIGTSVISEVVCLIFLNWSFVNYGAGYNLSIAYKISMTAMYYGSFAICIASIGVLYGILRSKVGLSLMAIRDNPSAAEVRGISIYKTKLGVFLVSSFITGVTGGVMYLYLAYITPSNAFSINWTIACVFMCIIGGSGTLEGPIIGAIIYIIIRQTLYNFSGVSMIIMGIIAILCILLVPRGIMGTVYDKFGLELLSVRRSVKKRHK